MKMPLVDDSTPWWLRYEGRRNGPNCTAVHLGQQEAFAPAPGANSASEGVMKRTKTTEITVETDEFFVVRRRDRLVHRRCVACGKVVQMVTVHEMTSIAGEELNGEQEARFLHAIRTPDGQVLICLNSLLTQLETQ